jgi:hypothetical protein
MSIGHGDTKVATAASHNVNSTGTAITVPVFKPVNLQRFGFVNNHGTATPTALVLRLIVRHVAGDSSSDETIADLSPSATVARGNGLYFTLDDRVEVNPGSEVLVTVATAAGASNTANIHLEYVDKPFVGSRIGNMTRVED